VKELGRDEEEAESHNFLGQVHGYVKADEGVVILISQLPFRHCSDGGIRGVDVDLSGVDDLTAGLEGTGLVEVVAGVVLHVEGCGHLDEGQVGVDLGRGRRHLSTGGECGFDGDVLSTWELTGVAATWSHVDIHQSADIATAT